MGHLALRATEIDVLATVEDTAHDCGIEEIFIDELRARPDKIAALCRERVKLLARRIKSAWPRQHDSCLHAAAQAIGFKDYQTLSRALRNIELSCATTSHDESSTSCISETSEQVLAATLPLLVALGPDEHPSRLQEPHVDRLSRRLADAAHTSGTEAEEFLLKYMRNSSSRPLDWQTERWLKAIEPDDQEQCYEFRVHGAPAMGSFVASYSAIVNLRDLHMTVERYRSGCDGGIEHVIRSIRIRTARLAGFFAGPLLLADLMLERGDIETACSTYEGAIATARNLMGANADVLVAHGGANDLYLLGLENLARAYLYSGDFARAKETVSTLFGHAFVDEDVYAQCLPAVIACSARDDKYAKAMLSLSGEADSRPLTSLVRAMVYSGAGDFDEAAEQLADAIVRQPSLAIAFASGIAEDDRHFRNSDLQFLLARRPDIHERMERAFAVRQIRDVIDSLRKKTGLTGSFKRQVLYWPDDEPVPSHVRHMLECIHQLKPLLAKAMKNGCPSGQGKLDA